VSNETTKGKPHRFPKKHDPLKLLIVHDSTEEKKASIIKEDIVSKFPEYDKATLKWFNETLQDLGKKGLVRRVEKRKEKAYYWIITEAGIKARNEEQED
jgi:DNA-binding HxlR family transcriptional regulator